MDIRLMISVWSKIDTQSEIGKQATENGYYIPGSDWIDFFNADADAAVGENRIELRLNSSDDPSEKLLEAFRDHMEYIQAKYPGVKVETREA